MDTVFLYTLVLILLSGVIGAFVSSRFKDRCLIDFKGFNVTIEEVDGDVAWGILNVYSTGIELEYLTPHHDDDGHIENSYIIYKDQFSTIQGIYRYHDALSEENQKERQKRIRKAYHPNFSRRLIRSTRNILNTFKDSIFQSVGLIIGQAQKSNPSSTLLKTQNKRITSISHEIIQVTANAYEPLLEKYIGKNVVLDMNKGDKEIEYYGILKEYTNDFVEILDIKLKEQKTVEITPEEKMVLDDYGITITMDELQFKIENRGNTTIFIEKIVALNYEKELNVICNPNSVVDFNVENELKEKVIIPFEFVREMDAIIPRKHCLIRHSGEMREK